MTHQKSYQQFLLGAEFKQNSPINRALDTKRKPSHHPTIRVINRSPKKKFKKNVGNCGEFRTFEPKIKTTNI